MGDKDLRATETLFGRLLRDQVPIFWWTRQNTMETLALFPRFEGTKVLAANIAGLCADPEGYGSIGDFKGLVLERRKVQGHSMAFLIEYREPSETFDDTPVASEPADESVQDVSTKANFGLVFDRTQQPNPYTPKPGDVWVLQEEVRCVVRCIDEHGVWCYRESEEICLPSDGFAFWLTAQQPTDCWVMVPQQP